MNWYYFKDRTAFEEAYQQNKSASDSPLIIFKHSTRCSTSGLAKRLFESAWNHNSPVFLVPVIEQRDISNEVAEVSSIRHESPQVLIFRNGKCIYHASHHEIHADEVMHLLS